MITRYLIRKLGLEVPVDSIKFEDGTIRLITNYDLELFRLGYIDDPRIK